MQVQLLVNEKYKSFEVKKLNAKLYIEVAKLLSQVEYDNSIYELISIAKKYNIDIREKDENGNVKIDESNLSNEIIMELLEIQNKPKDYSKIIKNYEIYTKILDLVLEKGKIEFDEEFWNKQNYSEVELIITQFRNTIR